MRRARSAVVVMIMDHTSHFAIFDLDDTLYDESQYVKSGFQAVAHHLQQHFGVDANKVVSLCWDIFKKDGRGRVFDYLLPKIGVRSSSDVGSVLVDIYRNHNPSIELFSRVQHLLNTLNRKRVRCFLVTDTRHAVQKRKVEALALGPFFDTMLFTDEYGWKKPAPAIYDYLERQCGVKWPETIVVGDDPTCDFVEPKKRGAYTVRIRIPGLRLASTTGDSLHEAHKEFNSFQKFYDWFRKIHSNVV